MSDQQTTHHPTPETMHLRLMRDTAAEWRIPQLCRIRQCRRSRICGGPAAPAERPITTGERLPPCLRRAEPTLRRNLLTLADTLSACIAPVDGPRLWPQDETAATELRVHLGLLHRIHGRPGLHQDAERASLAAWSASDPDPDETALYRRIWRHRKPEKRPAGGTSAPA
ncbi:hypothetical protein ASE36_08655 [Rhizobium sp. Root274]|uniref:hypothetical protein n=1 Tax=unclassified Rhizobium TaxID=2613769 RepID=UPI000714D236|nr:MULTISPECIES: hypothetical protein [unclassified Rhizobium]KQW28570.1 hypothetical protein ASC71_08665 [Rhizobium sp. Root1240]KRD28771.1 hypothetical protein ASE36_08655 [Rhizobium sp. Root274]